MPVVTRLNALHQVAQFLVGKTLYKYRTKLPIIHVFNVCLAHDSCYLANADKLQHSRYNVARLMALASGILESGGLLR